MEDEDSFGFCGTNKCDGKELVSALTPLQIKERTWNPSLAFLIDASHKQTAKEQFLLGFRALEAKGESAFSPQRNTGFTHFLSSSLLQIAY